MVMVMLIEVEKAAAVFEDSTDDALSSPASFSPGGTAVKECSRAGGTLARARGFRFPGSISKFFKKLF